MNNANKHSLLRAESLDHLATLVCGFGYYAHHNDDREHPIPKEAVREYLGVGAAFQAKETEPKLQKLKKLADAMYRAAQYLTTVTITHNVQAINPSALDICEERTELLGFDDVKDEVCARYRAEVVQGIKTEEEQIIALQKQQLADKDQLLDNALMKLDRLMKRGWWDRLWNNINL